jgi:hypothetical protein
MIFVPSAIRPVDPIARAHFERTDGTLRQAADALHLAGLRQVECLGDASCLALDADELLAVLTAVAGTCGPCF